MPTQHLIDFNKEPGDLLAHFFEKSPEAGPEAKMTEMLYAVAERGGEVALDTLLAAGYEQSTIAMALTKPSDDGRKKAPMKAHDIDGLRVLTLSSQGWQRVGKTGMRERKPNAQNIVHRLMPGKIAAHLEATIGSSERWQDVCRLTATNSHESILDWQNGCIARAWGDIRTRSDAGGEVGVMTSQQGTPRPDLIIYEEWWQLPQNKPWSEPGDKLWETAVGGNQILLPEVFTILVEIETTHKNNENLLAKVKRLNTAMRIGAADAVVWVTDDESIAARVAQFVAREGGNNDGSHAYASVAEMTGEDEGGMPTLLPDRCRPYWVPSTIRRMNRAAWTPPSNPA